MKTRLVVSAGSEDNTCNVSDAADPSIPSIAELSREVEELLRRLDKIQEPSARLSCESDHLRERLEAVLRTLKTMKDA